MERLCVFCGKPPEGKNKEHVLPLWLLKLTGDPKRNVSIGYNWYTRKEMKFSFDSMTFPACKSCNEYFSDFENKSRDVLIALIEGHDLNWVEAMYLLDWFDKVRTGLWLGYRYLSKNSFQIDPKFHINQRIRQKDRVLIINRLPVRKNVLTIIGANNPIFSVLPSCFSLLINGFLFTNISYDFMVSQRLGFPYSKKGINNSETRATEYSLEKGLNRVKFPLLKKPLVSEHLMIAQPLYPIGYRFNPRLYGESYVHENSYDTEKGWGKFFVGDNYCLDRLDRDDFFSIDDLETTTSFKSEKDFVIQTLEIQNYLPLLAKITYGSIENDAKVQRIIKSVVQFNKEQITKLKQF